MRALIDIRMDNAAFEDSPLSETAGILRGLADKLDRNEQAPIKLLDLNGNHVGYFRLQDADEERFSHGFSLTQIETDNLVNRAPKLANALRAMLKAPSGMSADWYESIARDALTEWGDKCS